MDRKAVFWVIGLILVYFLAEIDSNTFRRGHGSNLRRRSAPRRTTNINEAPKNYSGYQVWTVFPKNEYQARVLQDMDHMKLVNWYHEPAYVGRETNLLVSPDRHGDVHRTLKSNGMHHRVDVSDLGRIMRKERVRKFSETDPFAFKDFLPFDGINEFVDRLVKDHPKLITLETIGQTYEKRDLRVMKYSTCGGTCNKPILWLDAGIHAREWAAPATCLFIAHRLATGYKTNKEPAVKILKNFDLHILPLVNPDGYHYTHTHNRLWRKNRSPGEKGCHGVDLNRNFDFHFAESGTESDPCSEIYPGKSGFSEMESQAMRDHILSLGSKLKLYLSLHSYGQYILHAWGWEESTPTNATSNVEVAKKVKEAVKKVHGKDYTVSSAGEMYPAAGGSDDWSFGVAGVPFSYTMELRPKTLTDDAGFILPPGEIRPLGEEVWAGFQVMAHEIAERIK